MSFEKSGAAPFGAALFFSGIETMKELEFDGQVFDVIEHGGQPCLTLAEVAQALYGQGGDQSDTPLESKLRQVQKLYARHADEFTDSMTDVVNMQTQGGIQSVRVFSLRGAHLLGMFARTERAKRFRRWVLDVIDEHLEQGQSRYADYLETLRHISDRRAAASIHGRGLNQWRLDKSPLEDKIKRLESEIQPSLQFN